MLEIERIEDPRRLDGLRQEWTALLEASAADTLFLSWEWLSTWWRHLSAGRRLALVAVRRGGDLLALAPLTLRRSGVGSLVRRLEFLGTGTVGSDYLDVIVRRGSEGEALAALAGELGRGGAALVLTQLRAGGSHAAELARKLGGDGWRVSEEETDVCPFIPLAGHTWESYLATLGPEHRYNVGRRTRSLHRQADVHFEPVASEERRRELLATLFDLHGRRWGSRGGSEAFVGAGIRAFHEELSRLALEKGWLRLFALCLDGVPAAVLYGFRYRGTFYYYQMGWDPRHARSSVGLVALGLAIRSAIDERATEFDLLHGSEDYKFHWAREARKLARAEAYPPNVAGRALERAVHATRTARRIAHRFLPSAVVHALSSVRRRGLLRTIHATPAR